MDNRQVVGALERMADILEISGEEPFRSAAYRRAANAIDHFTIPLEEYVRSGDLRDIPGVGGTLAAKIKEMLEQGRSSFLEELEGRIPAGVLDLLHIQGVGPKIAGRLYRELGVESIDDLRHACEQHRIRDMKGLGQKKEVAVLDAILRWQEGQGRMLLHQAEAYASRVAEMLQQVDAIERFEAAGSLRRKCETIGDLDFVIATGRPGKFTRRLAEWEEVDQVLSAGESKCSLLLKGGCQADFLITKPEEFASALVHFTGSREHNVRLRALAKRRNESLSEYGLNGESGSMTLPAGERGLYEHLGLAWIPPELRENAGEIESADQGELPELVDLREIRGDLHMHTTWSDGRRTLADMARAAIKLGYDYIAVADHSQSLVVASGLDIGRIAEQAGEIDRLNERLREEYGAGCLQVLKSSEVDIKKDGTLDWPDEVLERFDLVVASIHSSLQLEPSRQTERLLAAMENPYVDIVAHPSGRVLGRRDGYQLDWEIIFRQAARRGVALEINASPFRLDLNARLARQAKQAGVLLAINTDAHSVEELQQMKYGVWTARKGWLGPDDILNSRALPELTKWLKQRRRKEHAT